MSRSPLIAIPARFSESASAHRFRALTTARALSEGVLRAGGEPLAVHPWAPEGKVSPEEVGRRLAFADGVLLPGGGDMCPTFYGQDARSEEIYDVDEEQDGFDLATARWALDAGVPLLAVCRGWHVVNVALGGDLEQHMVEPHRHVVHDIVPEAGSALAGAVGSVVAVSCFHHQRVSRLGEGLEVSARAADGTIEAAHLPGGTGWFLGVQWHPEDTVATDPAQLALFEALVDASRSRAARRG
jgi:putative glutamine amidotransferase